MNQKLLVSDLIIGGVLAYSGLIHLSNQFFFLESVLNYRIAGISASIFLAAVLAQSCFVVGCCLLFGVAKDTARFVAFGLFITFLLAQNIAFFSGLSIGCGCFGSQTESLSIWTIMRTGMFFALLSAGIAWRHFEKTAETGKQLPKIIDSDLVKGP